MNKKIALITGVCGQDGVYMADLLLKKGYTVVGIARERGNGRDWRLGEFGIASSVDIIEGDITDSEFIKETIKKFQPQEIYNFAAVSFVGSSWEHVAKMMEINMMGLTHICEAVRQTSPHTKLYHASSSEIFGNTETKYQDEHTPLNPCNPYGVSKAACFSLIKVYREAYNLFFCNGICYNHESPFRDLSYVTRKISNAVARISLGLQSELRLGNIDQQRDWGYAGDYVIGMWNMLQHDQPDDYILATGVTHTIRDFLSTAFQYLNIDNWEKYIISDPAFYRPREPRVLCGNSQKAKEVLGWEPTVHFEDLVVKMVEADLVRLNG